MYYKYKKYLLPAFIVIGCIIGVIDNKKGEKYLRFGISEIKTINSPSDIETKYITDFKYIVDGNKKEISINKFLSFEEIPIAIKGKRYKISSTKFKIKDGELYEVKENNNTLVIKRYDDYNIKSIWDFEYKYYTAFPCQQFVLNKTNKNLYIDKQDYGSANTEFETLLIKPNEMKSSPYLRYYFKEPKYEEVVPKGFHGATIHWMHY